MLTPCFHQEPLLLFAQQEKGEEMGRKGKKGEEERGRRKEKKGEERGRKGKKG